MLLYEAIIYFIPSDFSLTYIKFPNGFLLAFLFCSLDLSIPVQKHDDFSITLALY